MEDHRKNQSFFITNSITNLQPDFPCLVSTNILVNEQVTEKQLSESSLGKFHQDKNIYYFNMFFSPKQMADSIKRRNDNLEMLNFQNSDEEPDDVFNRRKKKVADLITKEEEQQQVMQQIKEENEGKYLAIIEFIKFFCHLKEKLAGIRTDYYSSKTFCALKNANQGELNQLTKVVQKMYNNIMEKKQLDTISQSTSCNTCSLDERTYQFLIIPRFLISRQKINRLSKDQQLQKNFQYLVSYKCLGHYNNEANKKMPEEIQMVYVRQLLQKKEGRQKFKKICSINHGNKFLKTYGQSYYQLYSKSLEYLRQLDNSLKKGKKYEQIKKDLNKIVCQSDEGCGSLSLTENDSSGIYNLKQIDDCLMRMENCSQGESDKSGQMQSEMRDQLVQISVQKVVMKKKGPKRLMSMPEQQEVREQQKPRGFSVRKSQTMQPKTTANIILVPPPTFSEI